MAVVVFEGGGREGGRERDNMFTCGSHVNEESSVQSACTVYNYSHVLVWSGAHEGQERATCKYI